MAFEIIFTKIINNENLKIVIKQCLKSNFLLHYFINIFLLKYVTYIYTF